MLFGYGISLFEQAGQERFRVAHISLATLILCEGLLKLSSRNRERKGLYWRDIVWPSKPILFDDIDSWISAENV